ncbi:MAG: hypothetical protein ACR2IF_11660 [Terriglobales bacterium]
MESRFDILLIELGVGIAVEIGIMIAILLVVRKSSARVESLANEVKSKALPTLESAQALLESSRPKIEELITNAAASAAMVKAQLERVDGTVTDVVDRTRLQVIRADELVTRTLDRVEETTELVQHTVVSPVRHIAGIVSGVTAVLGNLLGHRGRTREGAPQDEMFI